MNIYSLSKKQLLTKTWEYDRVYQHGKRYKGSNFSLIMHGNSQHETRLGISIHGYKKAAQRNRVKRIIKEFFRLNRSFLPSAMDIVFTVRQGFTPDSPKAVKNAVQKLLVKKGLLDS